MPMRLNWEEQDPNPSAQGFYNMLQAADEPLWDGCQKYSKLQAATRLLTWKSDCNVPESTFNRLLPIIKDMLPDGHQLVPNFYETKKMLKKLGFPQEKIDACKNHCMLFYKGDSDLTNCRVCGEYRYKNSGGNKVPNLVLTYMPIAPRLQRLFMSRKTAKEMTWHYDHKKESGLMVHPSDGEAWKHFDLKDPRFAEEIRNVRLGLCTDGFSPKNSNSSPYSLWPVFLTIYNLPPWMCLKESYVKLALVIPGRKSPGQNLDVFLRPLIDELKMLYEEGVVTYDAYRRNNFTMRAILLWTVSDFPAYAMLSGWSTHGKLACPYCRDKAGSFQLQNGGKSCWFDCHRRHLPSSHPFRRDKKGFRIRTAVFSGPPTNLDGDEIWDQVRHFPTVYDGAPYRSKNKKINGFGVTHNWVKRSIFWELPYWRTLLIRHNLDIMHIEKNVFENLFNTVMDTTKTKDNIKARLDVALYCDR
ncbi:hypothetical protein L6452_08111 [Arctium lappa]|uniref:Uncharacterized protein n=1 Tax=Arctium lappa TaxID=4217 RepID=A0ACB9DH00_ARCLA|nr:hypothetical protein L6452_08111 [Arctium lappa]